MRGKLFQFPNEQEFEIGALSTTDPTHRTNWIEKLANKERTAAETNLTTHVHVSSGEKQINSATHVTPCHDFTALLVPGTGPDPDSDIDGTEPPESVKFDFQPYTNAILGRLDLAARSIPSDIQLPISGK